MKTKILLIATLLGIVSISQAQEAQIISAKNDIANLNKKEKVISTEKRNLEREIKDLKNSEAKSSSKEQFLKDFGAVSNVTWIGDNRFDMATFMYNNEMTKAYYDLNSELIGTTVDKKITQLPLNAQNSLKSNYKDFSINEIMYFDDNDLNETNIILMGNEFDGKDCYIVFLSNEKGNCALQVNDKGEIVAKKEL